MQSIIFFGSSPFSNIVLERLVQANVPITAVITLPDKPAGRHLKLTPNSVKVLAEKHHLRIFTYLDVNSPEITADTVGLVAAYGKILKKDLLDKFNGQIYNIHPSLLPKYRGSSPLQQQILNGENKTGVTIIQMDEQMDHGPITATHEDVIEPQDTWISLGERLFNKGAELFISILPTLNSLSPVPQDHTQATYTKLLTRQDGFVPWEEFVPEKLATKFRAFYNWPGVWTINPEGKRLKLLSQIHPTTVQVEGKSPQTWPIKS